MDKRRFVPPAVGGSSLLVMFTVLALVVLALLSLTTVQRDLALSRRGVRAAESYYAADAKAQSIRDAIRQGAPPPEARRVSAGDGAVHWAYRVSIDEDQCLEVELSGDVSSVITWKTVSTADWQTDDTLPVYTG